MDALARKKTLQMFSNGVYILTACCGDTYGGATVTWVSQASFTPPLIMAAIRRDSNVFRCMQGSGVAAIHIVALDQQDIAQRFFTPTNVQHGCMNGEPFRPGATSAPILHNAPAYVECELRYTFDGFGDHAVVVLEVVAAACNSPVQPLTIAESPWKYGG